MYAGRGVLAVVCPGCGTAGPATGRKWHRTSLSRARRNLDRPARPGQGGAGPLGGCKSDHSQTAGGLVGTARVLATKTCRNQSRCLTAGRAKTTSVIDAITRRAKHEAGLPVLILKIPNNPILQSCALPDYNCGATLVRTGMCVHIYFHRIRIIAGPMETPLCKISF